MPAAQRPTTVNSMTYYAMTEEQQQELMPPEGEGEGGIAAMEGKEAEGKLLEALQSTPADPSDTRMKQAVLAGLVVPELLPTRMEQEQSEREQREGRGQEDQNREDDQQRRQQEQQMPERYEDESEEDYQFRVQQEEEQRRQQDERR